MDSSWLEIVNGDRISVGDIIDSEALAIGRDAIAIKANGNVTIYRDPAYPRLDYQSEVAHLISFHTQTFVGREQEWVHLARFAGQEAPGYLLIEALPGYGKSALIAHLVHRRETGKWDQLPVPNLLYFFIRQHGGCNTPMVFLQTLNSQLLEILKLTGGVPTDLSALRGQFSQLWSRALETANADTPLLLLVDGLDEMAPGDVTITHLLPPNLAPYVHVVVTSRPNPKPLRQVALEHLFKRADVLRLHTFGKAEIRALLQEHGAGENMATDLAHRVLAMTKGEPLFARFVCQEVADAGEAALVHLEQEPPANVEAYFRQQFRQLDRLAGGEYIWEILGLLVVALGGMTVEEIAEVLGLGKRKARKAIEPIQRFLLGESRLELMHLQLRKVVAEEFSTNERAAYRQKLLKWCGSYGKRGWPEETPDYVLAHYAQHLVEAEHREALYALIDKRWMEVKFERTHSPRAFAEDVSLVVEIAGTRDPIDWMQLVRGCLIYATLGSLATGMPLEVLAVLTQVGQAARALDYTTLIQNAEKRFEAYCLIAETFLLQNETEEADKLLKRALRMVEKVKNEVSRMNMLKRLARTLAQAGEKDGLIRALAAAETITDEWFKAQTLRGLAPALAQHGEFTQALTAVEAIGHPWPKACALSGVAQALARAGKQDRAVEIAYHALAMLEMIDHNWRKIDALSEMAQALAQAGEKQGAIEVADWALMIEGEMEDEWEKPRRLKGVAQALVQAKHKDGLYRILAMVEAINEERPRAEALSEVAQVLAKVSEKDVLNHALALGKSIEDRIPRALALSGVALALAQVGEETRARTVAYLALAAIEGMQSELGVANRLSEIAQALAKAGEKDEAANTADRALARVNMFRGQEYRSVALCQIAQALSQAGEKDKAATVISQALATAGAIEYNKAWALSAVTLAAVQVLEKENAIDVIKQALATIEAMENGQAKVSALDGAARALAQASEKDTAFEIAQRALAIVEMIGDGEKKALLLSEIARTLAQAEKFDHAMAVAEAIHGKWPKTEALSGIAQGLAQAGEKDRAAVVADQAWLAAKTVQYDLYRAYALSDAAQALAHAGEKDKLAQVLAVTAAIGEERDRIFALTGIAQAQALVQNRDGLCLVLDAVKAIRSEKIRVQGLSGVARALAQMGEKKSAAAIVSQALPLVETIDDDEGRVETLGGLVYVLALAEENRRAQQILQSALAAARLAGRKSVFLVLALGATTLAAIEQGRTLWQVYEAVMEVESWWVK